MNRLDADFSERFRAPPELVLFDVFRWFAFVFVAVFVISIGIRMSIGNAALFATLPAVFMAGWQAFAIWCFDEYELVRSAWSVAIARRGSWKSPWTVLRVPANRCRLVPAPPDSGAAFLLLFPSLGGRLWFAAPCGRTPESRAFWESSVPAVVEPLPRYRHPALAAIAKTVAVLALALPLTVAHLALFSFAMVPERPIQPACAAMVLFCLYASAAQALFLWSVGAVLRRRLLARLRRPLPRLPDLLPLHRRDAGALLVERSGNRPRPPQLDRPRRLGRSVVLLPSLPRRSPAPRHERTRRV